MEQTASYKYQMNHQRRIGPIKQGRMAADCMIKDLPQKRIAARTRRLSGVARCAGEMWGVLKSIRKKWPQRRARRELLCSPFSNQVLITAIYLESSKTYVEHASCYED